MINVEYVNHMGDSLTAVNTAKVSFGNSSQELTNKDKKLIDYLVKHDHLSPFEHCSLTVKIDCPIYISKQIMRHRTGAFNEISRRYTDKDLEFYMPDTLRKQHESNKQASYGALDPETQKAVLIEIEEHHSRSLDLYESLLAMGVCREQARGVLTQDLMTSFYMTMNLRNWAHFIKLRDHADAQVEVQIIARKIKEILIDKFGYSATILLGG